MMVLPWARRVAEGVARPGEQRPVRRIAHEPVGKLNALASGRRDEGAGQQKRGEECRQVKKRNSIAGHVRPSGFLGDDRAKKTAQWRLKFGRHA